MSTCITLKSAETTIVPHRIIWSWYTGRWWVGCYIWYSEEGTARGRSPPRPLLAVPNETAHQSTASVPVTILLYNGLLLWGFNVLIKRSNEYQWMNEWMNVAFLHGRHSGGECIFTTSAVASSSVAVPSSRKKLAKTMHFTYKTTAWHYHCG